MDVARVDTWAASIRDKPGGLATKLAALAEAGADLELIIARRAPDKPGTGVVFVTPLKGQRQCRAAEKAGFAKTKTLNTLRLEGNDKPGLAARITELLAIRGLNLRGFSAAAMGRRFVAHIALDSPAAAKKAARVLRPV